MRRCLTGLILAVLALVLLTGCTSVITSIEEEDGKYVLTGWKMGAWTANGFVWIGTYDHATKTMTIVEKLPK